MKTIKIVKVVKIFKNSYDVDLQFFPINLITKIVKRGEYSHDIFSVTNSPWFNYTKLSCIEVIDATPREQFLFYLNGEKPLVLKEE